MFGGRVAANNVGAWTRFKLDLVCSSAIALNGSRPKTPALEWNTYIGNFAAHAKAAAITNLIGIAPNNRARPPRVSLPGS